MTHTYTYAETNTHGEGWTNGWSRLATPMRGLKARAKMADMHEIRGASVTARGSAPVRRSSPFCWLIPSSPPLLSLPYMSANPSIVGKRHAAASSRTTNPRCNPTSTTYTDSAPTIPLEEFIRETLLAGQSAPKSAELRDKSPCPTLRVIFKPLYMAVTNRCSVSFPPPVSPRESCGTRKIW